MKQLYFTPECMEVRLEGGVLASSGYMDGGDGFVLSGQEDGLAI